MWVGDAEAAASLDEGRLARARRPCHTARTHLSTVRACAQHPMQRGVRCVGQRSMGRGVWVVGGRWVGVGVGVGPGAPHRRGGSRACGGSRPPRTCNDIRAVMQRCDTRSRCSMQARGSACDALAALVLEVIEQPQDL